MTSLYTQYRPFKPEDQQGTIIGGEDFGGGELPPYGQNDDSPNVDTAYGWGDPKLAVAGPPAAAQPMSAPSQSMSGAGGVYPSTISQPPPPPPDVQGPPAPQQTQSPYAQAVQKVMTERAALKRPSLTGPKLDATGQPVVDPNTGQQVQKSPSIWRALAAAIAAGGVNALGKGKNPEAAQGIGETVLYGPTALRAQHQYEQQVADADTKLGTLSKGVDILSKDEARQASADTRDINVASLDLARKSEAQDRINKSIENQIKLAEAAAKLGGNRVAIDAPQTPGTSPMADPMDFDLTTGKPKGKTRIDVPSNQGKITLSDPDLAKDVFHLPVGTILDSADYASILGKHIEAGSKQLPEGERQLTNVDQLNKLMESRYQVLHPGGALPPQYKLPPNATQKDYDRIDHALAGTESALGTQAQRDLANEARATAAQAASDAAADRREKAGQHIVMGNDPQTGRTVMASQSEAKDLGLQGVFDAPTAEAGKALSARQWLPLATATATVPEKMGILQIVDELDKRKALGPIAGRWNDFLVGRLGSGTGDPVTDRLIEALRTKIGLSQTLLINLHVGSRGGSYMLEHFEDLANAKKMNPNILRTGIQSELNYAEDRAMLPTPGGSASGRAQPSGDSGGITLDQINAEVARRKAQKK